MESPPDDSLATDKNGLLQPKTTTAIIEHAERHLRACGIAPPELIPLAS
eukprot:SAG22_NODE_12488_length_441_cov_0.748538_2_plen_49_part_01